MKSGRKHVMKKADGGSVKPKEDQRTKAMIGDGDRDDYKHGGKVAGKAAKPRLDRRARGGRMTPKSPFSGADTSKKMPYESKLDHLNEGGKGPTVRAP
jgi:hypothetical protein